MLSRLITFGILFSALPLAGCQLMATRATANLAENVSAAVLNQDDVLIVRDGGPAYLIAIDGLIAHVTLSLSALSELAFYRIFVDGVPLTSGFGTAVSGTAKRIDERVELSPGAHLLEVSAIDRAGTESLRARRITA